MTMGDRWTEDMVEELLHGAPIQDGRFDYLEFTRTLKHGAKEKDDAQTQNEGQDSENQKEGGVSPEGGNSAIEVKS